MSVLAVGFLCMAALHHTPRVEIELERLPGARVGVTVVLRGEDDGDTVFRLADGWGGVEGAGREIGGVTASSPGGSTLLVVRESDHQWRVQHPPGETISLAYTLSPQARDPLPAGRNDYRPFVSDRLFHAIGNHALLLPDAPAGPVRFSVTWTGFEGWTVASSLGPGPAPPEATLSLDAFRSCYLIAGDAGSLRLLTRPVGANQVGVAVVDAEWGFTDERFLDLVLDVVQAEREFFGDHTDPWFLVALTHNGGHAGQQGFSFGGTGLANCFALYCNTGLDLSPGGAHTDDILRLLAHEYFHTWNGLKIRIDAPEGAAYWFSEGFTDFYARRLLRRAGLMDDAQYLESLNRALAAYDSNPLRNEPNARIVADFWNDQHVSSLPYQRGDLLALALDEAIAAKSGGAESLDDLFRALYARSVHGEAPLTSEQLLDRVEASAGHASSTAPTRRCLRRSSRAH
jgi:predicted metalloprotease with PDZ domain